MFATRNELLAGTSIVPVLLDDKPFRWKGLPGFDLWSIAGSSHAFSGRFLTKGFLWGQSNGRFDFL